MPKPTAVAVIVTAAVAFGLACSCTRSSTGDSAEPVTLNPTEILVLHDLQDQVYPAEIQIKNAIGLDQNHNQVGEYQTLAQLAGRQSVTGALSEQMLSGPLSHGLIADGYHFASILPGGATGLIVESDPPLETPIAGVSDREKHFAVLAWPVIGNAGRAFLLMDGNRIYFAACDGMPSANAAVMYDAAQGTWVSSWPELPSAVRQNIYTVDANPATIPTVTSSPSVERQPPSTHSDAPPSHQVPALARLHIVFVTDDTIPGRTHAFASWLAPQVAGFQVVTYSATSTPATAAVSAGDVVLLDWNQHDVPPSAHWDEDESRFPNPLGARAAWAKPTVLLGSAGLMVAETWAVAGDRGCTCLEPLAYDLRDHPLARGPFPIDRSATRTIPTPEAFTDTISAATIDVLPVADVAMDIEQFGWCSYPNVMAHMPDVEIMCGGVNHKHADSVAIWRQGNLLHFGFQQSPDQMTANGRNLLANAIVYIADFHQDRPIARTRVGVGGETFLTTRSNFVLWCGRRDQDGNIRKFCLDMLAPDERATLLSLVHDPAGYSHWMTTREPYLAPYPDPAVLAVDGQLLAAGITYDSPEFLAFVHKLLRSDHPAEAAHLVANYLPECPTNLTPAQQADWIAARVPVLFAEDSAGYHWYVDNLAFSRGLASSSCRGPDRRDVATQECDGVNGACQKP